ncbi:MAG: Flp pilus assembly complex ATPase component TadA [Treponema sp.]|nr:Flp pilus assembly complex ATPase component TadA [Treponema sp.]
MNNFNFILTPAYCLYNGVAVVEQKGASITFIIENEDDEVVKQRIRRAFCNYLRFTSRQKDCPEEYKSIPKINFIGGNRQILRKYVSGLYAGKENIETTVSAKNEKGNDAAAVVLLDTILLEARNRGATDIHIEENQVKFRIKGRLEKDIKLDGEKCHELIQRIKFLAGMNVLEKRKSQDGHFVYGGNNPIFVRVSSMGIIGKDNSDYHESIVIRLLDTNRIPLTLGKLGFNLEQYEKIKSLACEKYGLVIVCGPTGAGKSTTAASILLEIEKNKNGCIKIISLEDPPEYLIPGVTQVQIDERMQNSYSDALIHVFRQDPDVLMIGEIRDEKSAAVACRAALTGHLVIATMHTGSPAQAILRLEDLGISKKLISSVVKGVIVQEMNHIKDEVSLIADVAVPDKSLEFDLREEMSEEKLDGSFTHYTNFREAIANSIKPFIRADINKSSRKNA